MATTYYVDSSVASSGAGTSWGAAFKTLGEAFTACTVVGDVIYISSTHAETLSASTTYAIASAHVHSNPLKLFSVNKTNGNLESGATISSAYNIIISQNINTNCGIYISGVTFSFSGSSAVYLHLGNNAYIHYFYLESCSILLSGNASSSSGIYIGYRSTGNNQAIFSKFRNCTFSYGHASQTIRLRAALVEFFSCGMDSGSVHPSNLLTSEYALSTADFVGCDLSNIPNISAAGSLIDVRLDRCKVKSLHTAFGTSSSYIGSVKEYDCSDSDTHGLILVNDYYGSLQIDSGVYCNDNASNNASWKIVTTSAASKFIPFYSPWISVYHSGSSAITPYLELLRSGSSTAFTDAEVWAEWSYKGTSGSTRSTIDNDGAAPLATPANQSASSKIASDWTGEHATSWFGKIGPSSSITPAKPGDISFRICVGAPSTTVYVDPQIRGLS